MDLHLYRPTGTEQRSHTYAIPVLIVDVTLSQGLADFGLLFLDEFVVAVEKAVVLLLGVALEFVPGLDDVFNHLGGGAAPKKS